MSSALVLLCLGASRVNCPDEEMERRIVERGKGSGRADDHAGAAKVRIATYHQQSSGCVSYHARMEQRFVF